MACMCRLEWTIRSSSELKSSTSGSTHG
ncbi:hypothetical protein NECAME_12710 [Necator americanus]|uniref:Uncharacterized protein n=1 Tax=Necator americanus TaxID=51031 RepID=W2SZW6_NECAM|nr:hypothetical protein NECAME_12710 [Necator americanus]ETN74844.1 hypothetical protein NECAME_12710 [Necator americanus]